MAEVKGTAVSVTPEYVKARYGESGRKRWLESLSPEAQAIFSRTIYPNLWFPLEFGFVEPTRKVCELFHGGRPLGAIDVGRFSADSALRGIYKFFVRLGSPEALMERASSVFATYYRPCRMEGIPLGKRKIALRISDFPEIHALVEARIEGWIHRALEISGCQDVQVTVTASLTRGDPCTEMQVGWR
jgi:hypothetical protein